MKLGTAVIVHQCGGKQLLGIHDTHSLVDFHKSEMNRKRKKGKNPPDTSNCEAKYLRAPDFFEKS